MDFAEWKVKGLFNANAQKCADEINNLSVITPENVLEYAMNEESELHKCFDWDDSEAAHKYRLIQARDVIRLIKIVPKDEEKAEEQKPSIRMFQITDKVRVYEPTRQFLKKPDAYQSLLKRAKNELDAFRARYATLSELEAVFEAIDAL